MTKRTEAGFSEQVTQGGEATEQDIKLLAQRSAEVRGTWSEETREKKLAYNPEPNRDACIPIIHGLTLTGKRYWNEEEY